MRKLLLAATAIAALATPVGLSAQTAPAPAAGATPGMRIEATHLRVKDLMDRDVHTSDNVDLGEVEDLIVDPASGRIVTAVIEVESRLGFTDKYIAIPLNQLRITAGERRLTIPMTREQVRALPGINYRD